MSSRLVKIELKGREWPMCLTLRAYSKICERYEGLPQCLEKLDALVNAVDNLGLIEEYTWLADQLLWAVHSYDDQNSENNPPTQLDMQDLLCPGDIPYLQAKVLECIMTGQRREVGAEAPKNGAGAEAAASAPNG